MRWTCIARTRPDTIDPGLVGWLTRARAAGCTVWSMDDFDAVAATVHTAIGRGNRGDKGREIDHVLPRYVPGRAGPPTGWW
jgi:hypothetical protein